MALDVESLELATLAAVPPQALVTLDGWLLGLDAGTVGRAHSAVPTRHEAVRVDLLGDIEAQYASRGLPAVFRLPRLHAFEALRQALVERGYEPQQPTLTQVGPVSGLLVLPQTTDVALASAPDDAWSALFLGEGTDPVDARSRLAILRRARDSLFASVRQGGQVVAVGCAGFTHGWCGVHGMRTAPAWRQRGLAGSILLGFAREAAERGLERAFLQVETRNAAAQCLYRRAGFSTGWEYEYWRRS